VTKRSCRLTDVEKDSDPGGESNSRDDQWSKLKRKERREREDGKG